MHAIVEKNTLFIWDAMSQQAFDNLKHAITHSSVLHPLEYSKEYLLNITSSTTTIGMVLVQEDANVQEHVIYYLSKSLLDSKT